MQKLNKKYTFDNLIVSNDNQKTIEMLKGMNTSANLFYIVGDVGVGKTHLLQAVANQSKHKNIIYVTVEQFMHEFTKCIKRNRVLPDLKKIFKCDILIIDDFQYCDNKECTQEDFLHIN
jgi:chromosomal replication initiator protein